MSSDPYAVLELTRHATQEEIKSNYRRLALRHHPDKNKEADATSKFQAIGAAYALLSDEEKRLRFDRTGKVDDDDHDFDGFAAGFDVDMMNDLMMMMMMQEMMGGGFGMGGPPRRSRGRSSRGRGMDEPMEFVFGGMFGGRGMSSMFPGGGTRMFPGGGTRGRGPSSHGFPFAVTDSDSDDDDLFDDSESDEGDESEEEAFHSMVDWMMTRHYNKHTGERVKSISSKSSLASTEILLDTLTSYLEVQIVEDPNLGTFYCRLHNSHFAHWTKFATHFEKLHAANLDAYVLKMAKKKQCGWGGAGADALKHASSTHAPSPKVSVFHAAPASTRPSPSSSKPAKYESSDDEMDFDDIFEQILRNEMRKASGARGESEKLPGSGTTSTKKKNAKKRAKKKAEK